MPEPWGTFVGEVDAHLAALADELVALKAEQASLPPRIFQLEQQAAALQSYLQTVAQTAKSEAPLPPLTQEQFVDGVIEHCLMHSGGLDISHLKTGE